MKKKTSKNDKTLEEQEKEVTIELKKIEVKQKEEEVKNWEKRRICDLEEKTKIDKLNCLRWLLESVTIDDEKTIIGSEPFLKSVFLEEEQWKIKDKIFKILENF